MSDKPAFVPTVINDNCLRLEADYVKGQDTATISLGLYGTSPRLTAFMADANKTRIVSIFKMQTFYMFLETIRAFARDPDKATPIRFELDAGKRGNDGKTPKSFVTVGKCATTNRIFIGMIDGTDETIKKQFFFKAPKFQRMFSTNGEKLDPATESRLNAAAWAEMMSKFIAVQAVTAYTPPPRNFGGGGGYQNRNNGGGQQRPPAQPPASGDGGFSDDDFSF